MKTFKRICIKDLVVDETLTIKRGREYTTTEDKDGYVTVFTSWWVSNVPVSIFAGEEAFTR